MQQLATRPVINLTESRDHQMLPNRDGIPSSTPIKKCSGGGSSSFNEPEERSLDRQTPAGEPTATGETASDAPSQSARRNIDPLFGGRLEPGVQPRPFCAQTRATPNPSTRVTPAGTQRIPLPTRESQRHRQKERIPRVWQTVAAVRTGLGLADGYSGARLSAAGGLMER